MADLRVYLKMDGSGFQQGLLTARNSVNRFGREAFGNLSSQIAGAFTAGALVAFTKKTIDFAGSMRDLSDRLGVNVEWLQKMNNAAGQAGASAEDLANFMGEVGKSREAAFKNPKGKEAEAFGRMGISGADITSLTQQQFVEKIIAAFASGASVQMENDVQEIGGKAAKKLIATFAQGIESSGPIIPESVIDQLDDLGDAFYIFEQGLMADLAPALAKSIQFLQDFSDGIKLFAVTLGGAWGGLGTNTGMNQGAIDAQNEFAQGLLDRDEKAKLLREQRRANRRQRERSAPTFDGATDTAKPDTAKIAKAYTDTLLSVGNFLGSSRGNIEVLAKETNTILREHTKLLQKLADKDTSLGIEVA